MLRAFKAGKSGGKAAWHIGTGNQGVGSIARTERKMSVMKKKTILIAGAVVLLAAGGIFFRVMKGMEKPAEYETRPTVSAEAVSYTHLSYMLPVVVAGGILTAISFAFGIYARCV